MDGYLLEVLAETDSVTIYATLCVVCDPKCKTCVSKSDICTSCYD